MSTLLDNCCMSCTIPIHKIKNNNAVVPIVVLVVVIYIVV